MTPQLSPQTLPRLYRPGSKPNTSTIKQSLLEDVLGVKLSLQLDVLGVKLWNTVKLSPKLPPPQNNLHHINNPTSIELAASLAAQAGCASMSNISVRHVTAMLGPSKRL
ncbi:hypothetical protein HYFRA_00009918 [Hymenoscyphus fraxineus]|uniref:Uncharacterized protein n=1 Tax=Hymenoscyphus fraxineus TaxID=746836 RepID=A0A9N9L2C0_9HELO|nr:hypothetical protein HYFRA_00009918 [Hymenoscyphus fraxineus]